MLYKNFWVIYFHFSFFSKKIVKNRGCFFGFRPKVVQRSPKIHYFAIDAGIRNFKSIIKKKKNKYDKTVLLANSKLK